MSTRGLSMAKQLEEDLRLLSVEARKRYPLVKEAAERSIITLRAKIAVMLRVARSEGSGDGGGFRADEELLRPFVLACNHADISVRLGVMSLSAFQRLLSRGAVAVGQFPNIVRVLRIQSLSHEDDILLRILQTLPLILTTTEFEVPEDSLRQAVLICSDLGASSSHVIRSLASATLRQLLTVLYGRVETLVLANDASSASSPPPPSSSSLLATPHTETTRNASKKNASKKNIEPASPPTRATRGGRTRDSLTPPAALYGTRKHAYMLFQDLCLMGKGESGVWLGHASMGRVLAMELIEELLGSHPQLFHTSAEFGKAIKNHVCPLVIKSLRSQADFPLMVRLMRLMVLLVVEFHELLATECEIFVTLLLRMIPRPGDSALMVTPLWHCALTLEVLYAMCQNEMLLRFLYRRFDADADTGASQIFGNIMKTLSRFVVDAFAYGEGVATQHSSSSSSTKGSSGIRVTEATEAEMPFEDDSGGTDDMLGGRGGWTLGAHMDRLTAQALAVAKKGRVGAQRLGRVDDTLPLYCSTSVLQMKDSTEPPDVHLAAVVLAAHECSLGIVRSLALTNDQINATTPMKGRPASSAVSGNEFGCGRRMSNGDMSALLNGSSVSVEHLAEAVGRSRASSRSSSKSEGLASVLNDTMRGMTLASWRPLNAILELVLRHCTDERLVHDALRSYQTVTNTCGVLELVQVRDTLISSLCAFALPAEEGLVLGPKNIQALETLFNTAHCLGGLLENSWLLILETFARLAIIVRRSRRDPAGDRSIMSERSAGLIDMRNRTKHAAESSSRVSGGSESHKPSLSSKFLVRSSSTNYRSVGGGLGELSEGLATQRDLNILENALNKLFEASKHLEANGLKHLLSSLGALTVGNIMESTAKTKSASESSHGIDGDTLGSASGGHSSSNVTGSAADTRGSGGQGGFVSTALSSVMSRWSRRAGKQRPHDIVESNGRGRTAGENNTDMPPFALLKLIETAEYNMHRIDVVWDIAAIHLYMIASKNDDSRLRVFCTNSLAQLTTSALQRTRNGETQLNISQSEILQPLCRCYQSAFNNTRHITLISIEALLKSCGHILSDGWADVIVLLGSVAKGVCGRDDDPQQQVEMIPTGFRSLQLVADEFLESLTSPTGITQCLLCLSSYAMQTVDLNISLTAIGAIWAMTDFVRQLLEDKRSVDGADELWMCIVTILQKLSLDTRASVRNSSMKTLFSTLATHGSTLSDEIWERVISSEGLLFTLLNKATKKQEEHRGENAPPLSPGKSGAGGSGYMVVHHSRDTSYKQWNESRVIALEGAVRIVVQFFPHIQTLSCFGHAWMELITIVREGLLCFRSTSTVSEAEVANEIFTSHVKAACRLMTLVSSAESNGSTQNSQLWRSLWDHVCDFGEPEDLVFDDDEMTSKQFIQMFGNLFISALRQNNKIDEDNSRAIHRSELMILKFVRLVERIMKNRPVRTSRSAARFSAVTSGAEREYIFALECIGIDSNNSGSENIQTEIVRVFERHIIQQTHSAAFVRRCCEAIQTVFKASLMTSRISMFAPLYTTLIDLYLSNLLKSRVELNVTVHQTLLEVVKYGLSSLTTLNGVSQSVICIAWDTVLAGLCRIAQLDIPGAGSGQQVAFLDAVMVHAIPLLHSEMMPSSQKDELVSILDHGSSNGLSSPLQEACTRHLFSMMRFEHGNTGGGATAVAPVVLRRCTNTLRRFVQKRREGSVENNAEIVKVLEQLHELRPRPGSYVGTSAGYEHGSFRDDHTHLRQIFPTLCDCVAALGASPEEKEISFKLASLFRVVGSVMGVKEEGSE